MPDQVRLKLTREEWKKIYKQELKRVERELLELAKRVLQDKTVSKNVAKAVSPLKKEDSAITEIDFLDSSFPKDIIIDRKMAQYLEDSTHFQIVPSVRYKGIISKLDTKTCTGYLTLGSKRLSFSYEQNNLTLESFNVLIESLRSQIQIYLSGEVTMDYEGNPKSMVLSEVESDNTLFD